ncbi:MAG: efflux RND transporter periplasmic adaptor subunit, partial [Cyanobacteria bacterium J06642_11]
PVLSPNNKPEMTDANLERRPNPGRFKHLLNRLVLLSLAIIPFSGMFILTMTILAPSLKNPEAKFYGSSKGYPAKQREAGAAIAVTTFTVGTSELPLSLSAPGESVALQSIEVRPEMEGVVSSVFVAEGDWVKAGQPLVQLNQNTFLDNLKIAESNLAKGEQDVLATLEAAEHDLARLSYEVTETEKRVANSEARMLEGIDFIQERRRSAIEAAEIRLKNVSERLERIRFLAEKGAIAEFEVLRLEDEYALRRHDLVRAQQGGLAESERIYEDRDVFIDRQLQLNRASLALDNVLATAPGQLKQAQNNLEIRQAQLREAYRDLQRTTILAPTDGLISVLSVDSGEFIDPRRGNPMMLLSQNIVFEAFVDQAQLNQVKEGDTATVRLTAYPGQVFTGTVLHVNPTIETNLPKPEKVGVSRQYTYSIWVDIETLQMTPGLQGYVQFGTQKTVLNVPESGFLHLSGGEGMVMVVEDGKATPRAVKVGPLLDNQREVMMGLKPGEKIIINPQALQPGDLVTDQEEE